MGQSAISVRWDDTEIMAENNPFYSESNTKILKESIQQMEKHPERNVVKMLEELEQTH